MKLFCGMNMKYIDMIIAVILTIAVKRIMFFVARVKGKYRKASEK